MMMRGIEKQHSSTVTSAMVGCFRQKETRGGVPDAGAAAGDRRSLSFGEATIRASDSMCNGHRQMPPAQGIR